jgi:hypothetical protein
LTANLFYRNADVSEQNISVFKEARRHFLLILIFDKAA